MWKWPAKKEQEQLYKAIFWMKNGAKIYVNCTDIEVTHDGEMLTSYKVTGDQTGKILYLCITDISAITCEKVGI